MPPPAPMAAAALMGVCGTSPSPWCRPAWPTCDSRYSTITMLSTSLVSPSIRMGTWRREGRGA